MSGYRWQDDRPLDGCEFAARLRPGMVVNAGPVYEHDGDPQVIDVAHVEELGDGLVRIYDVSGWSAVTCADMCMTIITPELADLTGFLLFAEAERLS